MGLFDLFRRKKNTPSSPLVSKKTPPEAPTATERRAEPATPIVSPTPKVDASEAAKREAAERAWLASEREDMFRTLGISDPRKGSGAPSQKPTPKSTDQELTKRESDLEQIARVAQFFGKTPTTAEGRAFAVQADHYIIAMLPPEMDEAKAKELSRAVIAANGYVAGNATWELRANAKALDDSFLVFSLMGFEKRTGKKADKGRTKVHSFGGTWSVTGTDVKGKMLAVFLEK